MVEYKERRPKPKREYDQFTATIETTAKRAALLNFFGDVKSKRILFLGDNDFTSVVTANLRTAQNITVIDIDGRILDEIEKISRAIEALDKRNQTARIYVCYGNSDRAKERFISIQEIVTSSGLMTRWVFDKFNRYHGAESIGSSSSLFVTEITPKTKPLIRGDYEKEIYTNN